jgi:hypothetical protein
MSAPATQQISISDAVLLAAEDSEFYGRFFFPKTCRQKSPPYAAELDEVLDNTTDRHVSAMIFRGGAKTTKLRLYMSKRVAYSISRTILVVGKSQEHAARSVGWLKRQVEFNTLWSQTFGLRKGSKWADSEIDIYHGADDVPIRIVAIGITGSVRGLNIDDYRPDLIIVDDPCDEENTATPEQREKIADLFFGALDKSLAPRSEAPMAKMVLLQTVLNDEDLISLTAKDPSWRTLVFSCFTPDGQSAWPERWSTKELLQDKQAHIDRRQLPLWMREMECKIISSATSAFDAGWLKYWDVLPEKGIRLISIDPVPPPKDTEKARRTPQHDDAVILVLQVTGSDVFVCETWGAKQPDEEEFLEKIFEIWMRWMPLQKITVETVLFARMVRNGIERKMKEKRRFCLTESFESKQPKPTRIRQQLSAVAQQGRLHVHRNQQELIQQFIAYPNVSHDDYLDALSIGVASVENWMYSNVIDGEFELMEEELKQLPDWRSAP